MFPHGNAAEKVEEQDDAPNKFEEYDVVGTSESKNIANLPSGAGPNAVDMMAGKGEWEPLEIVQVKHDDNDTNLQTDLVNFEAD